MEIIFSLIGLTLLGLIIRAVFKDKSVAEKPSSGTSWVLQIIFSLFIGFIVWSILPKSCKESRDSDPSDHMIIRRD